MSNTVRPSQRNNVTQIDLLALLRACWKQAWLIILVALLGGSLAYAGTKYFITPTYRTYFSAYINNSIETGTSTTVSTSDLSASQSLADTAAGVIKSATVLEAAAEQAGTGEEYNASVSTSVDSGSGIITVYVITTDPQMCASYASAIAEVAAVETSRIAEGSSMQIIDQPKVPTSIYSPSYTRNTMMGLLLGAMLVCAIVVLQELLNDRIQDQAELEARYGISVLGAIPDWSSMGKNQNYSYYYSQEKEKAEV
ncbi:MAG: Wzz/FepE/Etk N-terminal domain-containing protein [Clostridiales bacterium]|nr:Wzz/FepE/Etk N-terminal domain-containing protein [Clostridiales bacterium]